MTLEMLKSANTGEDDVELTAKLDRLQSTSLMALARVLALPVQVLVLRTRPCGRTLTLCGSWSSSIFLFVLLTFRH